MRYGPQGCGGPIFFFHNEFPPFSRSLAPFLLCSSAYLTPVQISRLYFVLIKSSRSSASSGPWVRVLARGTCTDFRLYKKTQKRSIGGSKGTRKNKGQGQKLDGDERGREIFQRNSEPFHQYENTISVELLIFIMQTKFRLNVGALRM